MAGLAKKAALVIGASRGIGEQIAVTLARNGYKVGVSAKTVTDSEKTPGTIYSVCDRIKSEGGSAIPILCDVRNHDHINKAVDDCIQVCLNDNGEGIGVTFSDYISCERFLK